MSLVDPLVVHVDCGTCLRRSGVRDKVMAICVQHSAGGPGRLLNARIVPYNKEVTATDWMNLFNSTAEVVDASSVVCHCDADESIKKGLYASKARTLPTYQVRASTYQKSTC